MKRFQAGILQQRLLALFVTVTLFSFGAVATFAETVVPEATAPVIVPMSGSGTYYDPFQITNCEELQEVNNNLDAAFVLSNDIECGHSPDMNSGSGFVPFGPFTGSYFDGRNHQIRYLTLERSDSNSLGLFLSIGPNSKVTNVSLIAPIVKNTFPSDPESIATGALAGVNEGTIHNVAVINATIEAQGIIGGIAGYNSGTIRYSSASNGSISTQTFIQNLVGGVTGYNTGNLYTALSSTNIDTSGQTNSICGGVVGVSTAGKIERANAISQLNCQGADSVQAGIVGQLTNESTVIDSFSTAYYINQGKSFNGGIIGSNLSSLTSSGNSFDAQSAGVNYCDDLQSQTCDVVNVGGSQPEYFVGNADFYPLNSFNVSDEWNISSGNYASLRTLGLTPMSPINLEAKGYGQNSVQFGWNPSPAGGVAVDQYRVEYSIDSGATWTADGTVTGTEYWFNNVSDSLIYLVRVIPINSFGEGNPSFAVTIAQKPNAVTDVSISSIQTKSVRVNWTDTSVAPSNATAFNIQYRIVGAQEWTYVNYTRFPETSTPVSGLSPSADYEFRVQSSNNRGSSEFSTPVVAKTLSLVSKEINSCEDLQGMQDNLSANYKLMSDIECAQTADWNDGKGFLPVGEFDNQFTGTLDGQGFTIRNLYVVRNDQPGGLIGFATGATIQDLKIDGGVIDRSTGQSNIDQLFTGKALNELPIAGSLVGLGSSLIIENVETNIPVYTNRVFGIAGGIVGALTSNHILDDKALTNSTSIKNVKSSGKVEGYIAGGISGLAFPVYLVQGNVSAQNVENAKLLIEDVQRSGEMVCTQVCSGGVALSALETRIRYMTNSGSLSSNNTDLGVEINPEDISLSCSFHSTGGLVGVQLVFPLTITDSSNSGSLTMVGASGKTQCQDYEGIGQGAGGLVGSFVSPLDGALDAILPGFVNNSLGRKKLTIARSSNSGAITSNVYTNTGGVVGFAFGDSIFDDVSSSGNVTSTAQSDPMFDIRLNQPATGGLIGKILGGFEIRGLGDDSATDIEVKNAEVKNSHASGNVYSNNISGGLIGSVEAIVDINKSYATGNVTGVIAGGFMGGNASAASGAIGLLGSVNIKDAYASGNVFARNKSQMLTIAGGFIGASAYMGEFNIENAYSSGAVRVENNASTNRSVFGGFAGFVVNASAAAALIPPEIELEMNEVGLSLHDGLSISNVFTASSVPPSTDLSGVLPYFASRQDVSPGIMSGAMFGATIAMSPTGFQLLDPKSYTENIYYDETVAGNLSCGFITNDFVSGDGDEATIPTLHPYVSDVCSSSTDAHAFKNTSSQAPLNEWNFNGSVWHKHANSYPTFAADVISDPPVVPDNPTLNTPTIEPPKVTSPVVKPITSKTIKTVVKYIQGAGEIRDIPVASALGMGARVFDTPTLERAGVQSATPKEATKAKATGFLAGALNLLLKYLKYIIAAIVIGAIASYVARRKKLIGNRGSKLDDIDEEDDYDCDPASWNHNQSVGSVSGDSSYQRWDGPPRGSPDGS